MGLCHLGEATLGSEDLASTQPSHRQALEAARGVDPRLRGGHGPLGTCLCGPCLPAQGGEGTTALLPAGPAAQTPDASSGPGVCELEGPGESQRAAWVLP